MHKTQLPDIRAEEISDKQAVILSSIFRELKPKPKRNALQFAKDEGYLSPESSAVTGRFVPFAYQEDLLRDTSDDDIELLVFAKSTRVGYTKIVNFSVAYDIAEDPCPQIIFQPNDGKAGEWSKKELKPMLRDMPVVGERILKNREDDNLNYKAYPGGFVESRGGKSANNYASATAKKVRFDEFSRFPDDVDGEGDPYELGKKRTESYWNGQVMIGSTLTTKGYDKTEARFKETDQRYRYVPCPHCGVMQVIDFKNIIWEKETREGVLTHLTHTAKLKCISCEELIDHKHKKQMDAQGRWLATAEFYCCGEWQSPKLNKNWYYNDKDPGDKKNGEALCKHCGLTAEYNRIGRKKRGYHIWAGYSYQPTATWSTIAETFVRALGSVDKMRAFVNTWLGESFEEENIELDGHSLMDLAEDYTDVPNGAKVILMTVDTQDDRLEYLIKAWGVGETSHNISHGRIKGDPINKFVWDELLEIKRKALKTQDGRDVYIFKGFIDMAGHRTDEVKKFVRAHPKDFIMLKGDDKEVKTNDARPVAQLKKTQKDGDLVMWVATNKAKDIVFDRLAKQPHEHGFIHHNKSFEEEWFNQLTSEKKVFKQNKKGFVEASYVKTRDRNEAIDLEGYQLAGIRVIQSEIPSLNLQIPIDN